MYTLLMISLGWAGLVAFLPGAYAAKHAEKGARMNVARLTAAGFVFTFVAVFVVGLVVVGIGRLTGAF